jgi:hypothetical protein
MNFLVGICIGTLLPFIPIALAIGWMKSAAKEGIAIGDGPNFRSSRLVVLCLLILTGLAIVLGTLTQSRSSNSSLLNSTYVVVSHPVWWIIGSLGFFKIIWLQTATYHRQSVVNVLNSLAVTLWGLLMLWSLSTTPDAAMKSFESNRYHAPINVFISGAFMLASIFLVKKPRIVTATVASGAFLLGILISNFLASFQYCLLC